MTTAEGGLASITCHGAFEIPVRVERAGELFTPEGERAWVEGWDPHYPNPEADRSAAGTVFVTDRHGTETTWVITAVERSAIRYARFDARGIVAAVEVDWAATSPEATRVEVVYRLTAVNESVRSELASFAANYDAYLASWREAIISAWRG
jgi:hypothetical protein